MIGIGTIINTIAVLVGGALGLGMGSRFPIKIRETVMHGLGLVVLIIGVHLSLETQELLIVLGSVLLGGIAGEILRVEDRLNSIGRWLEHRTASKTQRAQNEETSNGQERETSDTGRTRFSQAYLTASLVFCVGPMTILGS